MEADVRAARGVRTSEWRSRIMRRDTPFLNISLLLLGLLAAAAVAAPVLAQHASPADKGSEARWGDRDGSGDGAWGQAGMGGMGGMRGMRGGPPGRRLLGPEGRLLHDSGRLAEELKLTPEQREKLQNIGDGLARQAVHSKADLEIAQLDLTRELRRDTSDESAIGRQIDAITKLQGDLMKAAVAARFDARAVLTVDQRRQLATMRPGPRQDGPSGARRPRAGRP